MKETWTSGMNIQPMEGILVKVLSYTVCLEMERSCQRGSENWSSAKSKDDIRTAASKGEVLREEKFLKSLLGSELRCTMFSVSATPHGI